jgi:hypothetical protein
MLQWKPQVYAILMLVLFVAAAFLGGEGNGTTQFGW